MKCNVGKKDRILRIIVGVIVISLGMVAQSWWGIIGVIPVLTGTFRWCPAYVPLGISTDK
jgi:hypothetical protein